MKLRIQSSLRAGLWLGTCVLWTLMCGNGNGQGVTLTTVQGTVYLANGQPASGTLQVSWPAFTTAANQAVAAGRMNVTIATDGYVSLNLAANQGSTPGGLYYTAVYHLSDGTTSTEYWVVPAGAQASLAQVRAQVMPAAQAVQAVSKGYVDQSIQELTGSLLTASGGSLSGPLYLSGDPTQPTQAATKRYVDSEFGKALPLSGGAVNGPLTGVQLGAAYQADQFTGADFGAKLQACVNGLNATYGGTCDARNFTGSLSMGSNVVIATANATVYLPCATITTASQIQVAAGTRNVTLHGCALRGASNASGSQGGTVILYSGPGAAIQVGDPAYAADTLGFHIDNAVINTTASASGSAQGLAAYRTQELDLESLYLLGNSNQTGMTLDGTGNYTGGTFQDLEFGGFGTAVNGIGHQVANPATTDWVNASAFLRLHIDCPTSGGSPLAGTYGINLQQGDGNTFTGGDVEGCATALHLGANAQNNTIVGLRNENSTNQVVADAGSSYNNWMTGGTMFTGQLTDNGTRNSFLDTFHRSFNGLNGDWYGSQKDSTVTNHFRLGTGTGNERGLLNRYQTDVGYRWTTGLSDATAGEQFYQVLDELNNVYRLSIGQYNNGQSSTNNQTVINAAGTGAVVLNGSANAGTGGVLFGSGGGTGATVASINNLGNAQFNGTLQVGGTSTFTGSTTVRNNSDTEIDHFLWAGATANQKESYIYKDYTGASQWYMVKDASNNWALNSATGGLDSFKAYQSTNTGDTYINASNSTGHIRLNYEGGSGAETDIYSGSSANLVAAFLGTTAIKFPGLAAPSGRYCLQIDTSGYISNTGSACGSGGTNGTVNAGTMGQVAYYTGNGTTIAGMSAVSVTAGGTGATSAAQALQNLGGQPAMAGVASDGASGLAVSGNVSAPTTMSSVNKVINVQAAPYNAYCDAVLKTGSLSVSTSGITSGFVFSSSDAGKTLNLVSDNADGSNSAYSGVIQSVTGGNATLSPAPSAALTTTHWYYGHDDHDSTTLGGRGSGIQQAVIDAAKAKAQVQIPVGTCYVSKAIDLSGGQLTNVPVSLSGQGTYISQILGGPGQDTLSWPDNYRMSGTSWDIHDLGIGVDSSVDVSGPNGPFPNRIAGTAGGTTAFSPALSPLPPGASNGAISLNAADGTYDKFTSTGANFASLSSAEVLGQPLVVPSLGINATITRVADNNNVIFSPAYSGPASGLTFTYLNARTPPWYVGNCALAVPLSNYANVGSTQGHIYNVRMFAEELHYTNHSCGYFNQEQAYSQILENVQISFTDYGYIEALPIDVGSQVFTADTSQIRKLDINAQIPVIWLNGAHRVINGVNIYGERPNSFGPLVFVTNPNVSTGTVNQLYYDCYGNNRGENERWSGGPWSIKGSGLSQCGMSGYVNWLANSSDVDATISSALQVAGSQNTFSNTSLRSAAVRNVNNVVVSETGFDNSIQAGSDTSDVYVQRKFFADLIPPQEPVGKMDGGWVTGGSGTAPFVSGSDLVFTCRDLRYATAPTNPMCVSDPNGTELSKSYVHSAGAGGFGDSSGTYAWSLRQAVGTRFPRGVMYAIVQGQCEGTASCTGTYKFFDVTPSSTVTQIATCAFTFTNTWTTTGSPSSANPCKVDATNVPYGDVLTWATGSWSGSPTAVDQAVVAFQPVNSDTIAAAASTLSGTFAPLNSPSLQGTPTAPTHAACAGDSQIATGAYVANCASGGAGATTLAPAWMQFLGDGSEGAYNCTTSCNGLYGEHWYSSFTIQAGATATVLNSASNGMPLVIRSAGACTIAGTLSFSGQINTVANWGGGGGGGGGGTSAGTAGSNTWGSGGGGTAGAASGGTGGNGSLIPGAAQQKVLLSLGPSTVYDALSYQNVTPMGGAVGGAGNGGAAGGKGGGMVVLDCASINLTGTIDVSGQAGTNAAANNAGAGGGGGGGVVILRSPALINSGTIKTTGGAGGGCGSYTGCGAGGAGASGWSAALMY